MVYTIQLTKTAERDLKKLPTDIQRRIIHRLRMLGEEPRPSVIVKMRGRENQYRLRMGHYRIIYQVKDDLLIVLVVKIGHRRDVYR